jgi:NADH:ubiquinone oxidoreductase subunit 4 (subunit M)
MDGTEVVAGAAAVALPISIGFAGTIIVVIGMRREAPTNWAL